MTATDRLATSSTDGVCVAAVRGELDMSQAAELPAMLTNAARHPDVGAVTVDLAEVTFPTPR